MNKKNCANLKINFLFFRNSGNKNTQLSKNPETTRTLKAQSSQTIRHQEKEKIKHKSITQQEQLKSFKKKFIFYFFIFQTGRTQVVGSMFQSQFHQQISLIATDLNKE